MKPTAYLSRQQAERVQARRDARMLAERLAISVTLETCGLLNAAAGLDLSPRADRIATVRQSARTYAHR